jgi:hypothetical protein
MCALQNGSRLPFHFDFVTLNRQFKWTVYTGLKGPLYMNCSSVGFVVNFC